MKIDATEPTLRIEAGGDPPLDAAHVCFGRGDVLLA